MKNEIINANVHSASIQASSLKVQIPIMGLLALTMTSFIATANETVPAGLLPQIAQGFNVSEAWAGQLVTLCALGAGMSVIPLTIATRSLPRKLLLLLAIGSFFVFNAITALSPYYLLTLVARFIVGIATGLVWSLLAGYARRMVPESLQGRAMAIAMVGIPLALALGVPLSAWLGNLIGWRSIFGLMSGLSLVLMIWVFFKTPDYPGQKINQSLPMREILMIPGVRSVLFVVMTWILAHYMLYTYIAPLLTSLGLDQHLDLALLIFGIAAMIGIWITGMLVDRFLRILVLMSLGAFALVSLLLGIGEAPPLIAYFLIAVWGLSFSGAPTLLQTALADASGENADVAQSMLVMVFNLSFAGSGVIGGVLLETVGIKTFPWVLLVLLMLGLYVVLQAKSNGFIPGTRKSINTLS